MTNVGVLADTGEDLPVLLREIGEGPHDPVLDALHLLSHGWGVGVDGRGVEFDLLRVFGAADGA